MKYMLMAHEIRPNKYGTPAAWFKSDDGELIFNISVAPMRSRCHLLADAEGEDTPLWLDFGGCRSSDPLVRAVFDVIGSRYHWETPAYRDICAALGLDPDYQRPTFAPADDEFGQALLIAVNTWDSQSYGPGQHSLNFLLDAIDVLRDDKPKPAQLYDDVMAALVGLDDWPDAQLPKWATQNGDLVRELRCAFERIDLFDLDYSCSSCSVEFLPSLSGPGYRGTVHGGGSPRSADFLSAYRHLSGVAAMPGGRSMMHKYGVFDQQGMQTRSLDLLVASFLRQHGVLMLSAEQADAYRNSPEAAFWREYHSGGVAESHVYHQRGNGAAPVWWRRFLPSRLGNPSLATSMIEN